MGSKEALEKRQKAFYAGQALIQHYGCFGCHNIQGWTYAPLTCVNLTGEADKDINKFDFGMTPIPKNRWDWFYTKIARPRVFDIGRADVTRSLDRLRMPWFGYLKETNPKLKDQEAQEPSPALKGAAGGDAHGEEDLTALGNQDENHGHGFSHEQVEALVTLLMSLTSESVHVSMQKLPSAKDVAVDRGERVIRSLNCIGCHLVGLERPLAQADASKRGLIPLEALLTSEAQGAASKLGLYSDRNEVSLDNPAADAEGFLNFGRGTYLTQATLPVLLSEKQVRRSPLEPWTQLGFRFKRDLNDLKKKRSANNGRSMATWSAWNAFKS